MIPVLVFYTAVTILHKTTSSLPVSEDPDNIYNGNKLGRERHWSEVVDSTNGKLKARMSDPPKGWRRHHQLGYRRNGGGARDEIKGDTKRGIDIGLHLNIRTTPSPNISATPSPNVRTTPSSNIDKLNKLEKMLEKALGDVLISTSCPTCIEGALPGASALVRRTLKPAYKCDDWDAKIRLCILERNVGDTVTFYLSTGIPNGNRPSVTWKKEFHMRDSKTRTEYVIEPDNSPQNIIIGKQGYELRVSPITEIDIGNNLFSATLEVQSSPSRKLYFVIRIVPIDLGFVYVGETIDLNLRSYISLPPESLSFRWYMEKYGENGTLPSNMRTSSTSSSIKISELRQEQEGILACSIYTNLNFLATKKRFLIKDLIKNKDVLELAPDHNLTFPEDKPYKKRRTPRKKIARTKKDVDVLDFVERGLMKTTAEADSASAMTNHDASTPYFGNYESDANSDLQRSDENDESAETNPVEDPELGENGIYGRKVQYMDERLIPQGESSMVNQRGRKPSSHFPADEEPYSDDTFSREPGSARIQGSAFPGVVGNGRNYVHIVGGNNEEDYEARAKESEIVLNIEKIRGPRTISAEESISKFISSCDSDLECSPLAACFRGSLKQRGYCKCLPGFYGVGIFCRESTWMGNSDFGVEAHGEDGYQNPA